MKVLTSYAALRTCLPVLLLTLPALARSSSIDEGARSSLEELAKRPVTLELLKEVEERVTMLAPRLREATVGLRLRGFSGGAQGSGVIVTEDGYVLTAGHVIERPGRRCTILLANGETVTGRTLGVSAYLDIGLVKITKPGKYPFAEMASTREPFRGEWCIGTGHPNGQQDGRPPVVRLGRVLSWNLQFVQSDCPIVVGDSGGPLFDLEGHVVGIHSRIHRSVSSNYHAPIRAYRDHWDKLVHGDAWASEDLLECAYLGVQLARANRRGDCLVDGVELGHPAERAGVQSGDRVTRFAGNAVRSSEDLLHFIRERAVGERVQMVVERDGKAITLDVQLGARP